MGNNFERLLPAVSAVGQDSRRTFESAYARFIFLGTGRQRHVVPTLSDGIFRRESRGDGVLC